MNIRYKLITLIIFIPIILWAQAEDIKFEHLSVKQGLSHGIVTCILQGQKGFMWFGTEDGLNKYDGYKFKIYKYDVNDSLSLSQNWITTLYEDHLGDLWIGTLSGGLCRYNRNRDTFIRYTNKKDDVFSLSSNTVNTIFEFKDQDIYELWIGGGGANKYNRDSDNFTRYYPEKYYKENATNINNIKSITQDHYGKLWIGAWNKGLYYFDPLTDDFIRYKPKPQYSKTFINRFVRKLHRSPRKEKNILWMGSYINGLYKIDVEDGQIKNYRNQQNDPFSISNNIVTQIYQQQGADSKLWIGTEKGLNKFDIQTEKFIHYQHDPANSKSLDDNFILSISEDKSGLLWVGTYNGINKFEPEGTKFNLIQHNPDNPHSIRGKNITSIHESGLEGQIVLWIGTDGNGLSKLDYKTGEFTRYKHDPDNIKSISSNRISTITESQHEGNRVLWVSTLAGLNKFDLKSEQFTSYKIPHDAPIFFKVRNQMQTHCVDKNGTIWIGAGSYLYSFDPKSEHFTKYNPHRGVIHKLYIDKFGMLWIGTNYAFYKFNTVTRDINNEKEVLYKSVSNNFSSIAYDAIDEIFEDKSENLWIGTAGGLNRFDRSTETFTFYGEKDGLLGEFVYTIQEDSHGNLWLSSNKGISKFNPSSKTFRNYDTSDGLPEDASYFLESHINHDGKMFFGSRNGLIFFHPDSIIDNTNIPPIVITDFQIFNKSIQPGNNSQLKKEISEVKEITLSYGQSIFSFEFSALDYHSPEKNKYAYKMEGVDPDWVFTDASRRFVSYTNLNPGEYTFIVKGSNNDGLWNEEGTSVKIIITPPWWKTDIAYPAYALIFITILIAFTRYESKKQREKAEHKLLKERELAQFREAKLRAETAELHARALESEQDAEKERMRSRIAGDLHDEIGSNLGSIAMITETLEKKKIDTNKIKKRLKDIQSISRLTSESMRDIVWFVNPDNDDPKKLISKMRQTAGVMLGMEFNFSSPKKPLSLNMNLDLRRNLYLLYKEILHNIIKHSHADQVDISLSEKDNVLTLEVKDNGIGFNPSQKNEGNGLNNFRHRAQKIGGKLDIYSKPGDGTKIKVNIKIP